MFTRISVRTVQTVKVQGLPRMTRLGHCSGCKLSRPWRVLLTPKLGHDLLILSVYILQANASHLKDSTDRAWRLSV